jgi:hypothetical protein
MEHQDPVNLVDISHLKRIKGTRSNSTPLVTKLMSLNVKFQNVKEVEFISLFILHPLYSMVAVDLLPSLGVHCLGLLSKALTIYRCCSWF